ncbi:pantoate--beta-alanine ligase [Nakamurella sp.]|uniref:pantoate--beta-alanine ligase n=1 Tax=Nakamurella sp. TaxID=1869182 RepID=UPI0037847910
MRIVRTVADLRAALAPVRGSGSVGLVPTMGALHDGHLELARQARADNDAVVLSIFVNPTQFNDPSDLAAYPRDEGKDVDLAASVGVDYVFAPEVTEVYPPGFSATVTLHGPIVEALEGAHRGVGHFQGVTTVVAKLFGMVSPDRAYFGQKDAQQVRVVQAMVADLNIPTQIVVVSTVREPDGLAMSSRNRRLSPFDRARAAHVAEALRAAELAAAGGISDAWSLLHSARKVLTDNAIDVEYLELVDADTFRPIPVLVTGPAVLAVAVVIGGTRLIDNVVLRQGSAS